MTIAYSYLLFIVLGIFLFCYFVATRVWIKVDKQKERPSPEIGTEGRRDFLYLSSVSIGCVGVATFIWPFLKSHESSRRYFSIRFD